MLYCPSCNLSQVLGFIEHITREELHPFADFTRAPVVPPWSGRVPCSRGFHPLFPKELWTGRKKVDFFFFPLTGKCGRRIACSVLQLLRICLIWPLFLLFSFLNAIERKAETAEYHHYLGLTYWFMSDETKKDKGKALTQFLKVKAALTIHVELVFSYIRNQIWKICWLEWQTWVFCLLPFTSLQSL